MTAGEGSVGRVSGVVTCPDCQRTSSVGTNRCPQCGYPLALETSGPAGTVVDPTLFVSPGDERPNRPTAPPPDAARTVRLDPRQAGTARAASGGGTLCPSCRQANPTGRQRWCAFCAADMTPPSRPRLDPPPPPAVPRARRWPAVVAAVAVVAVVGGSAWALGHRHSRVTPSAGTTTAAPIAAPTAATHSPTVPSAVAVPRGDVTGEASSTLPRSSSTSYGIANTLDGRDDTAWNSNSAKVRDGIGVHLTYRFAHPVKLRYLRVLNGYVRSRSSSTPYLNNERLRAVTVTTATGQLTVELKDDPAPQTVAVPVGRTSTITLRVDSVYPGAKYRDLALTEIRFYVDGPKP